MGSGQHRTTTSVGAPYDTFSSAQTTVLPLPSSPLPSGKWDHLPAEMLADPEFFRPQSVELVLSAGVFDQIDLGKIIPGRNGAPNARATTFGWVLSGYYRPKNPKRVHFHADVQDNRRSSKEYRLAYRKKSGPIGHQVSEVLRTKPQSATTEQYGPSLSEAMLPLSLPYPATKWGKSGTVVAEITAPARIRKRSRKIRRKQLCENKTATSPSKDEELCQLLEHMFTLEAVSEVSPLTSDEIRAEDSFKQSYSRLPSGRFVVRIPLLGVSRQIALRRLHQTEQRHQKYPHLRGPYVAFMRDYLESGHMELAPPLRSQQEHYYLPHHAVHRPEDPPEKIRIVFNASQASSTGLSLNQLLLPGPRLQLDIWKAVLNFRFDRWVFSADIRQMFRQIEHPPVDRDFLRICWRFDPHEPVQDYRLITVTYGTASAPYLACRVLRELAQCYDRSHPEAAELLRSRTYVDDVNGGGDSIETALKLRDQLIDLLAQAQLELRKWAANDLRLLENIPTEHRLPIMSSVPWESDEAGLKLLGLFWNPVHDVFGFQLSPAPEDSTKRQLASQIARIFDPLGWLMPIIVYVRSIFQIVCQNDCEWDQLLPSSVSTDWKCFADQLPLLSALQIPRFVAPQEDMYLVGFADASERAYEAVIYLVSRRQGRPHISLLMSKARIAPMKALTLPRLELCAAHLLARSMKLLLPQFPKLDSDRIFAFTDSTIVLSWITANPTPVWKVFVGNRVANIVENVSAQRWFPCNFGG